MYQRQYRTRGGYKRTLYYTQFVDWRDKRRTFPCGDDFKEAKKKRDHYMAQNAEHFDFDAAGHNGVLSFAEWAAIYPQQEGVKNKRSLPTKLTLINCHLVPFFRTTLLAQFTRADLVKYVEHRMRQTLVRGKKFGAVPVRRGTV